MRSVTFAPATTAPEGSRTVPLTEAVACCAGDLTVARTANSVSTQIDVVRIREKRLVILPSQFGQFAVVKRRIAKASEVAVILARRYFGEAVAVTIRYG